MIVHRIIDLDSFFNQSGLIGSTAHGSVFRLPQNITPLYNKSSQTDVSNDSRPTTIGWD